MRTLLIAAVFLSTSFAQAGPTSPADTTVVLCPDLVFESTEIKIVSQSWEEIIPELERPSGLKVFESTWWPMTCELNPMGDVTVRAEIPEDYYPLQDVPAVATCSAEDSKGKVHMLVVKLEVLDAADPVCLPRADTWHASESTQIYLFAGDDGMMDLPLLSGYDFADGVYQAKDKDGTALNDVTCKVTEGGAHMTVAWTGDTAEGEGYCALDGKRVPFDFVHVAH